MNKITRHRGAGQTTRRLIDEGAIGDVRMIRGTYLIPGYDAPTKEWLKDPAEGTPWLDYGAHGVDIVRWLGGAEATSASRPSGPSSPSRRRSRAAWSSTSSRTASSRSSG